MSGSYTWVYTVPDSTVPGPANQTLSSVLAAQGHTSGASDLQPAPGALQTAPGVGNGAMALRPTVGLAAGLLAALWAL
ncbi:hypothetical protein MCAP1_000596 [Malassezia caprae]|uniref:Uncharacterized protein n=1 Tax=Malassezia caprae TaxID=1381934 RepID=A0AAF0E4P0_9BASI|nr:hypothetical protein MCAP1_000596 [Malassezia caprae]